MDWRAAALLGLAAVAGIALARLGFLAVARRPVWGVTLGTSISEEERLAQRHRYRHQRFEGRWLDADTPDDEHKLRVKYVVEGREYLQVVRFLARAGDKPGATPLLWYNPRDPSRVSAQELRLPLTSLLVAAGSAAWLLGWL